MILKLHVIQGQPADKTVVFGPGDYFLGRGGECHIRFNSDWVSRQHCQLRVSTTGVTLRDLGSRNGTLINGRLSSGEQALQQGDQIQVGPVTFAVTLEEDGLVGAPDVPVTLAPEGESEQQKSPLDSTTHHPFPPEQP